MTESRTFVECSCGQVTIELYGSHIYCTACHCDDCQAAAHALEAMPASGPVMDPFDGTHYILHRKDRYAILGEEKLLPHRLRTDSPTRRMVTSCCASPMFLAFDNSQHWITAYRSRVRGDAPPLQSRISTKFRTQAESLPDDAPAYRTFPLKMIVRILLCRVQMAFGR
jgi:hypothetical protein